MSYRVTVSARFEAAHNLIDYPGGPEPLHGHSYRVEAVLESRDLQQHDVAVDFVAARTFFGVEVSPAAWSRLISKRRRAPRPSASSENARRAGTDALHPFASASPARVTCSGESRRTT